jgi:hypothetical protein
MRTATSHLPQWLPLLLNGGIIVMLLRQIVELGGLLEHVVLEREGRAAVGKPAVAFTLPDMNSRATLGLETFGGQTGVLLFVSGTCGHCHELAAALPSLGALLSSVVVVCADSTGRLALDLDAGVQCVLQSGDQVARSYEVKRFPTAVVIDGQLKIAARRTPASVDDLREMLTGEAVATGPA